ncbi:MAG: formate dehydrogenase accessory protein FdhE [Pseudomonas sp.]
MADRFLEPEQISASASTPPYSDLPPTRLFALRAERLEKLATEHPMGDYLRLLAGLCQAQQQVMDEPPASLLPTPERLAQARTHKMPPLAVDSLVREDGWQPFLDALLERIKAPNDAVTKALDSLRQADAAQRRVWAVSLLGGNYQALDAAIVPFLGAALQVAWSQALLTLPEGSVTDIGSGAHCPCCGSPAMTGVIRHRGKQQGLRYLVCSLCACEWHFVRVKCVYCDSSKDLHYASLGSDRHTPDKAPIRAECCPGCQSYFKLIYLDSDPDAEGLAADLASLALDLRMDLEGYQRQAPNLLLAPGG